MLKEDKYIFRITHIDNISHIFEYGITHKNSSNANPNFRPIGDPSLISTRATFELDNGKCLGDYIPFYFGYLSPMLYVIQNGYNNVSIVDAHDIVYCVSSINKILESKIPFVYTDGHATDLLSSFYSANDIIDVEDHVDFNAAKATYWADPNDLDLKRRKEAEFLIESDLPLDFIRGFVVRYEFVKEKLVNSFGVDEGKIHVESKFYYG